MEISGQTKTIQINETRNQINLVLQDPTALEAMRVIAERVAGILPEGSDDQPELKLGDQPEVKTGENAQPIEVRSGENAQPIDRKSGENVSAEPTPDPIPEPQTKPKPTE